jgi:hypothetical protein
MIIQQIALWLKWKGEVLGLSIQPETLLAIPERFIVKVECSSGFGWLFSRDQTPQIRFAGSSTSLPY